MFLVLTNEAQNNGASDPGQRIFSGTNGSQCLGRMSIEKWVRNRKPKENGIESGTEITLPSYLDLLCAAVKIF